MSILSHIPFLFSVYRFRLPLGVVPQVALALAATVLVAMPMLAFALDTSKIPLLKDAVPFSIEINGDKQLRDFLQQELKKQRQTDPLFNPKESLKKIARQESEVLRTLLDSRGYYNKSVSSRVENNSITYRINTGNPFYIRDIQLKSPPSIPLNHEILPIKEGDILIAKSIIAAQEALHKHLEENYCLFKINVQYKVVIDRKKQEASVTLEVEPSQNTYIGEITFTGLQSIHASYLRKIIDLKPDQCFKRKNIEQVRITLLQSNLIARVDVDINPPVNNRSDIIFEVTERKHRTVSAGIGYESSKGAGVSLGWSHRNVSGKAEKLDIDTHFAEKSQTVSSRISLPHFKQKNQLLTLFSDFERENTDAYLSRSGTFGAEISRGLSKHLRLQLGGELIFSKVEEDNTEDDYALLSAPITLKYDRRENPLNPLSGWVAAGSIRPYWDAYNPSTRFLKSTMAISAYYTLDDVKYSPTFATRAATGTITGLERPAIPADLRFYVGGGGSVRGYPYQSLDAFPEEDADGGLSYSEFSFETRFRASEHWGYVIFLDGGFAFAGTSPTVNEELLWATGFGVRYFTGFMPIRVDFAFPLDKRDGIDDDYQFYISIGQAF